MAKALGWVLATGQGEKGPSLGGLRNLPQRISSAVRGASFALPSCGKWPGATGVSRLSALSCPRRSLGRSVLPTAEL